MVDLSHQFRLFDPPEGASQLTEWPDASKVTSRPSAVPRPRSLQGIEIEHVGTIHPLLHASDDVTHEQLPMLQSAREIMAKYAPAEGDRMYRGTDLFVNSKVHPGGVDDPRAGEPTERQMTTDHRLNQKWMDPATGERSFTRTAERKSPPIETDEEFWERKGIEAAMGPEEAFKHRLRLYAANALATPEQIAKAISPKGRTQSHTEHIRSTGDVGVIPLGEQTNPLTPPGNKKPMVAGGQHRIAAMAEIDPDRLLPVEHWRNTFDAKFKANPKKRGEYVKRQEYT